MSASCPVLLLHLRRFPGPSRAAPTLTAPASLLQGCSHGRSVSLAALRLANRLPPTTSVPALLPSVSVTRNSTALVVRFQIP